MNYKRLKVPELKKLCKERGIKGYSKLRKKQIIQLLDEKTIEKKCITCKKNVSNNNYIQYDEKTYEHIECYNHKHHIQIETRTCSICLDNINPQDEFKTECNHYFHKDCINTWDQSGIASNKCPNCRQEMKKSMPFREIHSEIVRTSEYLERTNGFTQMIYSDYDNLMFQAIYLMILYKKRMNNNNLQLSIDSLYMDMNTYITDLLSEGVI